MGEMADYNLESAFDDIDEVQHEPEDGSPEYEVREAITPILKQKLMPELIDELAEAIVKKIEQRRPRDSVELAVRIAAVIENDLNDRRDFHIDSLEQSLQDQIKAKWIKLITSELDNWR